MQAAEDRSCFRDGRRKQVWQSIQDHQHVLLPATSALPFTLNSLPGIGHLASYCGYLSPITLDFRLSFLPPWLPQFSSLPPELVQHILLFTDPVDVSRFSRTGHSYRQLVYESCIFDGLQLDDPRKCLTHAGDRSMLDNRLDWIQRVKDLTLARSVIRSPMPNDIPEKERIKALRFLLSLITNIPPLERRGERSRNLQWVHSLLDHHPTYQEHQLLSRLHIHYGITVQESKSLDSRVQARSIVYDMSRYNMLNHHGPFLPFGDNPDWTLLDAIHHVISRQIYEHGPLGPALDDDSDDEDEPSHGWKDRATFPLGLMKTQIEPPSKIEGAENEMWDWAGMEGDWILSFCFCDHRVLIAYNNSAPRSNAPLDISTFENPNFIEVYRSIPMTFHLNKPANADPSKESTSLPRLTFTGTMPFPTSSQVTGEVLLTKDGKNIRWSFVSSQMWHCQGVQIGGVGSQFGVLGSWTTVHHDQDDPVGPFWLRKVRDLEEQEH
ncbi:hypothetical protein DL96DRAFT_1646398 [Flagelloscypha sp. PMI_526]|nr:hypothetical protein DL96DRAFT_1646398 [Flagelloscypha sp. PMI_526]